MARHFPFHSSLYPKPHNPSTPLNPHNPSPRNDVEPSNSSGTRLGFLALPITLTLVLTSLPHKPALAAPKAARRKKNLKSSQLEALTPEQLKQWVKDLPVVSGKVPYTDLVRFKEEGRLKHVIKLPGAGLRLRAEVVLVVLDDYRVFRTVLPSVRGNAGFWDTWDGLKIDALCVNAYSPRVKRPAVPEAYLGFLWKVVEPVWSRVWSRVRPKKESRRVMELRKERERLREETNAELARIRREKEEFERGLRRERDEEEQRWRKKRNNRVKKHEVTMMTMSEGSEEVLIDWNALAHNQSVAMALGIVIFVLFYRVVVLNYKKQKKDYDDRLKIERAEAEENIMKKQQYVDMVDDNLQGKEEENSYVKMAMQFMKSGARVRKARSRSLPQYLEKGVVMFKDVAGLGNIRVELEEIVKFFTHGDVYRRRGIKIPGGILLCGPPGVGKTLLAKAVAGEAGVNFFSISASQFVEIYVGVGAARVRSLYKEAKESAPSVVFIDELDAVGRTRGFIKGSGGQERDATLNQLLVCLDGFEGKGQVITIASTNRPDILDPALVRPGRFDRKIIIPKPGLIGRTEILKVHARKKPVADDVDYKAVAGSTNGMVGAELANIVEVAAIHMMRDGRTEITTDDLLQAAEIEESGMLDKVERSPESWRQIALNEAATAVAAANFPDLGDIEYITIAPRAGRVLGYVRTNMDDAKLYEGLISRQAVLDYIVVQLAPRAADELWYGENQLSTIWAETADDARRAARSYVMGGLSEKHYGISTFLVDDRINDIDLQAMQILNLCYERAKKMLEKNRKLMDAVADELVGKKTLTKDEFNHLVELHGCLESTPPSILDIRAVKRAEFEEMMKQQEPPTTGIDV